MYLLILTTAILVQQVVANGASSQPKLAARIAKRGPPNSNQTGLVDGVTECGRNSTIWECAGLDFSEGSYLAEECAIGEEFKTQDLDHEICAPIRRFNQTALDQMEHDEKIDLVTFCACQLGNMYDLWSEEFDSDDYSRRLATMVDKTTSKFESKSTLNSGKSRLDAADIIKGPNYLWSDLDVTIYGVSIYTATADYFYQQQHNASMRMSTRSQANLKHDELWQMITKVCKTISTDKYRVYRYMENIRQASVTVFYNLLQISDLIKMVYDASKACKLPLILQMNSYKTKTRQSGDRILNPPSMDDNFIPSTGIYDVDSMLRVEDSSSPLLLKCDSWQFEASRAKPAAGSEDQCSMMLNETLSDEWLDKPLLERSMKAVRCGCQLLDGHKSEWARIMQDPNVEVMSKALTNYMNRNQVPDFAHTPVWAIFEWAQSVLSKFSNNRKATQKEVVKTLSNDQDPLTVTDKKDIADATELIRRACNYVVFNYNKGSKNHHAAGKDDFQSIRYLDNLQTISQDPMFVFHLTLQDANLFKLYALSKMCLPYVT